MNILPSKKETNILLELLEWNENSKDGISEYLYKQIKCDINNCWENKLYRDKLLFKNKFDVLKIKECLINRYIEKSKIYDNYMSMIFSIKDVVSNGILKYYLDLNAFSAFYFNIPVYKADYDSEIINYKEYIISLNSKYIKITDWISYYTISKELDKDEYNILNWWREIWIFLKLNNKDILKYSDQEQVNIIIQLIQDDLLQKDKLKTVDINSIKIPYISLLLDASINENILKSKISCELLKNMLKSPGVADNNTVKFHNKHEWFYSNLEKWSMGIKNPYMSKWIHRYLDNGRKLPFYKNHVFKLDFIEAKKFLIMKYIEYVQYKNQQILKEEKRNKKYEKKLDKFINQLKGEDFDDSTVAYRASSNKPLYINGYIGTYAYDEAGYTNDDIDTLFDGDPNAYWNID